MSEATKKRPRAEEEAGQGQAAPVPCVGLPVQYSNGPGGELVPGILSAPSRTEPGTWSVKIFLSGASVTVTRAAVGFSPTPRPGCWNFLPGWSFTPPQPS